MKFQSFFLVSVILSITSAEQLRGTRARALMESESKIVQNHEDNRALRQGGLDQPDAKLLREANEAYRSLMENDPRPPKHIPTRNLKEIESRPIVAARDLEKEGVDDSDERLLRKPNEANRALMEGGPRPNRPPRLNKDHMGMRNLKEEESRPIPYSRDLEKEGVDDSDERLLRKPNEANRALMEGGPRPNRPPRLNKDHMGMRNLKEEESRPIPYSRDLEREADANIFRHSTVHDRALMGGPILPPKPPKQPIQKRRQLSTGKPGNADPSLEKKSFPALGRDLTEKRIDEVAKRA